MDDPGGNDEESVTPVFIVGANRNGTTWLGNSLLEHFPVAGARHPLHYGIKEANVLRNHQVWGDLSVLDNLIRYAELFSSSDFFRLIGGAKEDIYRDRPTSFYESFVLMMNDMARRQGLRYWTAKLEPAFFIGTGELDRFLNVVSSRCRTPKFIGIRRDYGPFLTSVLNAPGVTASPRRSRRLRAARWVEGSAMYFGAYPRMERFVADRGGLFFTFEGFRDTYDEHLAAIGAYLGVAPADRHLEEVPRNTSFQGAGAAAVPRGSAIVAQLGTRMPGLAALVARRLEARRSTRSPLSWRILKAERFPDELEAELAKQGNAVLVPYVRHAAHRG